MEVWILIRTVNMVVKKTPIRFRAAKVPSPRPPLFVNWSHLEILQCYKHKGVYSHFTEGNEFKVQVLKVCEQIIVMERRMARLLGL